jgi:hypothetical protein
MEVSSQPEAQGKDTPIPQSQFERYGDRREKSLLPVIENLLPSRSAWGLVTMTEIYPGSLQLTYSMVHSPSWEANWFAASQEIPRISRNLKVHYRTHKRPPPVSILGQSNPLHIPTSHLGKIH